MTPVVDEIELPECDAGCGALCRDPHEIRDNYTWTCRECDAEAWAERLADERAGR